MLLAKSRAQAFYDKLKKKVYPNGVCTLAQIKMSPKLISRYMEVSEQEALQYCNAIVYYGLSTWEDKEKMMVIYHGNRC